MRRSRARWLLRRGLLFAKLVVPNALGQYRTCRRAIVVSYTLHQYRLRIRTHRRSATCAPNLLISGAGLIANAKAGTGNGFDFGGGNGEYAMRLMINCMLLLYCAII
eukprot:345759-Rhodomonas_salina.1